MDTSSLELEEFTMADKTTRYTPEFKRQLVASTSPGNPPIFSGRQKWS